MRRDKDSVAIVHSTMNLAHSVRLLVIAEGVEDEQAFSRLAAMACDQVQGCGISRHLPAEQFSHWCAQRAGRPGPA